MDYHQQNLHLRPDPTVMSCGHQFATPMNGCSQCSYGPDLSGSSGGFSVSTSHGGYDMHQGNEYFCSPDTGGPPMLSEYFVSGGGQSFIPYQYQSVSSSAHLYSTNNLYTQQNMSKPASLMDLACFRP